MLHALCLSHSAFPNPKLGTRPKGGSPEDKSKIESGCILYHEWLYFLMRLHTLARQTVSILLEFSLDDMVGFSPVVLSWLRF
jgi:hypothetical protein